MIMICTSLEKPMPAHDKRKKWYEWPAIFKSNLKSILVSVKHPRSHNDPYKQDTIFENMDVFKWQFKTLSTAAQTSLNPGTNQYPRSG